MRKTLTLTLLGASWLILGGCEQQQQDSLPEPAEGLPQNEAPRSEPDVQIGRSDNVDPGEPADLGAPADPGGAGASPDSPASDTPPAGGGADIGGGAAEPPVN